MSETELPESRSPQGAPVKATETVPSTHEEDNRPPHAALLTLPPWLPPLFFLLLAVLFLWRSVFTGDVFLPAGMLGHVGPYSATVRPDDLPSWNPLRWDGIAQFYPWRHFAAQTLRSGTLPLWNPYQFCGTPFVANSQSAVFYPGNLLFVLLPTAHAFGASAILHLTLCGWFMYLLLRRLGCAEIPGLLGGMVYAYSSWQVNWLQLPTFLATSCWFPLLLRQTHLLIRDSFPGGPFFCRRIAGLAGILGMLLLAGHLQIAFYGLLAGTLWTLCLLLTGFRTSGVTRTLRSLGGCAAGLALGGMIAAPQVLPALELSRVSHRVGKPTPEGYLLYTELALPTNGLAMLTLPTFFGNDYESGHPYWGFYVKVGGGQVGAIRHNAAETAVYIGVLPLLFGALALTRSLRKRERDRRALFFVGLAVLAMLMALGTLLNALFYFGVPGFGQSGSPARVLVLWALAGAALSALGLDHLLRHPPTRRESLASMALLLFVFAVGLTAAQQSLAVPMQGVTVPTFNDALSQLGMGWFRLALMMGGGLALLALSTRKTAGSVHSIFSYAGPIALLFACVDLFSVGIQVNPTARPEAVYPITPGIAQLKEKSGHDRIFPLNRDWSLIRSPHAVLPPNGAMVYGLHDVQGYDSLLTGQYKAFANQFALVNRMGSVDASPIEVGNMVFFQNANAPLVPWTAAQFAASPSTADTAFNPDVVPKSAPIYTAEREMAIFPIPQARPRAELVLAAGTTPVEWQEDLPTRVTLKTNAPAEGSLRLADQFYPGWTATIDGQPASITRQTEAPIFRSVAVPAGSHTIAFRYQPASFRVGLYLACAACFALALFTAMTIGVKASPVRS